MQQTTYRRGPGRSTAFDQASSAVNALASSMVSAVEDFLHDMTPPPGRAGRSWWERERTGRGPAGRGRGCGCDRTDGECCAEAERCPGCGPSSCDCRCCIGDVDLVVYTRFGEARVVPVEIHNPRRKTREVEIELSDFTTRGGKPAGVTAQILGAGKVTLEPCATHELIIVTRAGPVDRPDGNALGRDASDRVPDVDDCVVAVADLRIVGCDMRPVRIAVAILPRRCDAYEVVCQHECC